MNRVKSYHYGLNKDFLLLFQNEKEYFYGSHYSNVGTVLHFLVRLEPFSSFFIEFQGGRFDVPGTFPRQSIYRTHDWLTSFAKPSPTDRTFYSTAQTWDLSSSVSQSDVKELIPEFFYLPEFLMNHNKFEFGYKQDGQFVDGVLLPPWAQGDARYGPFTGHLVVLDSNEELVLGYLCWST